MIFILPLISILYEPAIFYYTFFAATVLIKMKNENLIKIFLVIFLIFIPSIIVSYYSAFHIISKDGFDVTKKAIDYLRPLILGEAFPKFSNGIPASNKLKLQMVKKKLKSWNI